MVNGYTQSRVSMPYVCDSVCLWVIEIKHSPTRNPSCEYIKLVHYKPRECKTLIISRVYSSKSWVLCSQGGKIQTLCKSLFKGGCPYLVKFSKEQIFL